MAHRDAAAACYLVLADGAQPFVRFFPGEFVCVETWCLGRVVHESGATAVCEEITLSYVNADNDFGVHTCPSQDD